VQLVQPEPLAAHSQGQRPTQPRKTNKGRRSRNYTKIHDKSLSYDKGPLSLRTNRAGPDR